MAPTIVTPVSTAETSTASYVVTAPTSVASGEIVVIALYAAGNPRTITSLPSGFAHAPSSPLQNTATNSFAMQVIWKLSAGSEPSTYTVGYNNANFTDGYAFRIQGANTTTPFSVTNVNATRSTSGDTTPVVSLTTDQANELLLWIAAGSNVSGSTYTQPSGYTNNAEIHVGAFQAIATKAAPTSGTATGNVTGSLAGNGSAIDAWLGAVAPSGAAAVVPKPTNINRVPSYRAHYY